MTQFIGDLMEYDNFDLIDICEEKGLKEFEPSRFLKIRELGTGSFGEVWMCYDLLKDERVAVKYTKISSIKDKDILSGNIASFFREKEIMESITLKSESISKFFGAYYEIDRDNYEIKNLILVSESGDYNLADLLNERISLKKKKYDEEEVLGFIAQISEGYKVLQELKIYHSDTKLQNIVFSKSKNKFIIIDFGVSKILPSNKINETKVEDFAKAGTPGYYSPEKESYFNWAKEQELKEDSNDPYETYPKNFNPYKCDMWSLGVCLEKMIGQKNNKDNFKILVGNEFLKHIIEKLKEKDWMKRFDAFELYNYIEKNGLNKFTESSKIIQKDAQLISELNQRRYERDRESGKFLYKKYFLDFLKEI